MEVSKKKVLKRIKVLINLAKEIYDQDPNLAKRYIKLAWKYKLKANIKLSKEIKFSFCKKCFTPWIPGKTVKIRVRNGWINYTCLNCKRTFRYKKIKW